MSQLFLLHNVCHRVCQQRRREGGLLCRVAGWCYKSQSTGIRVSIESAVCILLALFFINREWFMLISALWSHHGYDCLTFSHFSSLHCRYNVVFMFLTYFLPIGSMTFTYARVGLELWGSQSIGECTQRQLDNIKSKRKVRRTKSALKRF